MRIRLDKKKPKDKTQWHVWFAWHPIRIGPHLAWLEFVERCGTFSEDSCGGCWSYEYRDVVWHP
jgi:hypothetical protein